MTKAAVNLIFDTLRILVQDRVAVLTKEMEAFRKEETSMWEKVIMLQGGDRLRAAGLPTTKEALEAYLVESMQPTTRYREELIKLSTMLENPNLRNEM